MQFDVTTSVLRTQQGRLQSLADDTAAAVTYAESHLSLTWADSMAFAHVDNVARDVRDALTNTLGRIKDVLSASGTELTLTADDYDARDEEARAAMDAQVRLVEGAEGGH